MYYLKNQNRSIAMKKIFPLFFLFLLSQMLSAQEIENPVSENYSKQIGLNFSDFILRYLSFSDPVQLNPAILILYKKEKNGKRHRYGLGGDISWSKNNSNDVEQFLIRLNFNYGREHNFFKKRAWSAYYGWEVRTQGSYTEQRSNQSFGGNDDDKIWTRSGGIGGGVLMGIQWHINKRMSLLTETGYGLSFNYILPFSKNERYSLGTVYFPPTSMLLMIYF